MLAVLRLMVSAFFCCVHVCHSTLNGRGVQVVVPQLLARGPPLWFPLLPGWLVACMRHAVSHIVVSRHVCFLFLAQLVLHHPVQILLKVKLEDSLSNCHWQSGTLCISLILTLRLSVPSHPVTLTEPQCNGDIQWHT